MNIQKGNEIKTVKNTKQFFHYQVTSETRENYLFFPLTMTETIRKM